MHKSLIISFSSGQTCMQLVLGLKSTFKLKQLYLKTSCSEAWSKEVFSKAVMKPFSIGALGCGWLFLRLFSEENRFFWTKGFSEAIEEMLSLRCAASCWIWRHWHSYKAITFYPSHFSVESVFFLWGKKKKEERKPHFLCFSEKGGEKKKTPLKRVSSNF